MAQGTEEHEGAERMLDPNVTIRPYRDADFDDVAKICGRIWVPDVEGYYDRITFGRVMTAGSLRRSSFDHDQDAVFDSLMAAARKRAKLGGPRVEEMLFRRLRMYTTADVFISRGYSNADAELNMLVVNPADQGHGIGQALYDTAVDSFRQAGARGFFTMISDVKDFSFVESRGLSLIQKKEGRPLAQERRRRDLPLWLQAVAPPTNA